VFIRLKKLKTPRKDFHILIKGMGMLEKINLKRRDK